MDGLFMLGKHSRENYNECNHTHCQLRAGQTEAYYYTAVTVHAYCILKTTINKCHTWTVTTGKAIASSNKTSQ